jgi:hypothetical protein
MFGGSSVWLAPEFSSFFFRLVAHPFQPGVGGGGISELYIGSHLQRRQDIFVKIFANKLIRTQ